MSKRLVVLCLLFGTTLASEVGSCWKIKNDDMRRMCESRFEGKKNCWMIKEYDRRAYCEAVAEHKRSCWKIKNTDYKEMCFAETKQR